MISQPTALRIENVSKHFGGVAALRDVSFLIPSGSITALIGPNGAGKSTIFNLLTNLYQADAGSITFFDRDLRGMRADRIARLGLVRTFQTARCFTGMSVLENVLIGAHCERRFAGGERALQQKARNLLALFGMAEYAEDAAVTLPLGLQKLLEIARALMASPKLLLLDEPAAGLNDVETDTLAELLKAINRIGISIVVVEHNMSLVMSVARDIVVLDSGRVIAMGSPAEVQRNERVIEAYVGRAQDARALEIRA